MFRKTERGVRGERMTELPKCAREGCEERVKRKKSIYCSYHCSNLVRWNNSNFKKKMLPKIKKTSEKNRGRTPWNKDLTKETDERVKKYSKKITGVKCTEKSKKIIGFKNRVNFIIKQINDPFKWCIVRMEMSNRMKGLHVGEKNPMYGKIGKLHPRWGMKHTEESKKKNRESHLGKTSHRKGLTWEQEYGTESSR